jgi:hypothetical protein
MLQPIVRDSRLGGTTARARGAGAPRRSSHLPEAHRCEHDRELVSRGARRHIAATDRSRDPLSDLAQDLVARDGPQTTVESREAIEVDTRRPAGRKSRLARAMARVSCPSASLRFGSPVTASVRARSSTWRFASRNETCAVTSVSASTSCDSSGRPRSESWSPGNRGAGRASRRPVAAGGRRSLGAQSCTPEANRTPVYGSGGRRSIR